MHEMLVAAGFSDRVIRAYLSALHRFEHRPEVTGIDIGYRMKAGKFTRAKTPVIRIHVREKFALRYLSGRERFPKTILGVPTDVVQATYRSQHTTTSSPHPTRTALVDPLRPGVSIAHRDGTAGTIGMFAIHAASNAVGILSSGHVLAPDGAKPGDPVVQPGPHDGGWHPDCTVATHSKRNILTDSAFAALATGRAVSNAQYGSDIVVASIRWPVLGDVLEKSGRTTGVTQARVVGIGTPGTLGYGFILAPVDSASSVPISDLGDSGAIWYDPTTGAGVGLHCKGNTHQTVLSQAAIASALVAVLSELGLKIVP